MRCEFVGEPGDTVGGMVEHGGGDTGFFDGTIAPTDGGDPTEVGVKRFEGTTADDECGVGGVIGDSVEDLAGDFGFGVDLMDAGVDDFDGGDDVIGSVKDVEDGAIGTVQRLRENKGELDFDAGDDEAGEGEFGAIVEEHVIKERAVIGFADVGGILHSLGGEADFVTFDTAAGGEFEGDPLLLDGIGVIHGDVRVFKRELFDLGACLLSFVQTASKSLDGRFIEHLLRFLEAGVDVVVFVSTAFAELVQF